MNPESFVIAIAVAIVAASAVALVVGAGLSR